MLVREILLTVKKSADNPKEYFKIVHHTKNNKTRFFPLTTDVKDILSRLKDCHERNGIKSGYLFPAESENGVITNNTVYNFLPPHVCLAGHIHSEGHHKGNSQLPPKRHYQSRKQFRWECDTCIAALWEFAECGNEPLLYEGG